MIQNKTIVICDRCGEKVITDYVTGCSLFSRTAHGDDHALSDWIEVEKRHLCPDCAQGFQKLKDEHRKEAREFIGIETIEIEL